MLNGEFDDLIGKPYAPGGTGPHGYDCEGLAREVLRRMGIVMPTHDFLEGKGPTDSQLIYAQLLAEEEKYRRVKSPRRGLLVAMCYPYRNWVSHVGVALDDKVFIHAVQSAGEVLKTKFSNRLWASRTHGYYACR